MQTAPQLSRIGLLSDLHYDGSVQATNRLYESISALNRGGSNLLVVLGDLIDAESQSHAKRLLNEVAGLCHSFRGVRHYIPGNHDLDHLSKEQFYAALGRPDDAPTCSFKHGGLQIICMDGNFSPDGTDYDHGHFDWKNSYVPDEQLAWLEKQLAIAPSPAVILSHQRIDVSCIHSVRNHQAVRDIIKQSNTVKVVVQGHQHADDLRQIDGTTYYTLSAHKDDSGPAILCIDSKKIWLSRNFRPFEIE